MEKPRPATGATPDDFQLGTGFFKKNPVPYFSITRNYTLIIKELLYH